MLKRLWISFLLIVDKFSRKQMNNFGEILNKVMNSL